VPLGVREREGRGDAPLSIEVQFTPETWARLIGNPEDRRKAAQSYIESVGGKLHGFWYAFGAHDGYTLWEAPDNVSMAVVALAIAGGGALQLPRDDRPPDRRRNDGCAAQGPRSRVPSARRVMARALLMKQEERLGKRMLRTPARWRADQILQTVRSVGVNKRSRE
jgi:uncharacterized protein with GYD domain